MLPHEENIYSTANVIQDEDEMDDVDDFLTLQNASHNNRFCLIFKVALKYSVLD